MTPSERARFAAMESRLNAIDRELRMIPARFPKIATAPIVLRVGRGNVVHTVAATTYRGLIYDPAATGSDTVIPTGFASASPTYVNGLTEAHLMSPMDWVTSLGQVWLSGKQVRSGSRVMSPLITQSLPEGAYIVAMSFGLPILATDGNLADVYLPRAI